MSSASRMESSGLLSSHITCIVLMFRDLVAGSFSRTAIRWHDDFSSVRRHLETREVRFRLKGLDYSVPLARLNPWWPEHCRDLIEGHAHDMMPELFAQLVGHRFDAPGNR
ncbi:hypothetical protein EXIGLDRAFT_718508 [Exidia glandulosa HHB12029]|uniref:Uncharacterized protein n=1 Tax=Exidia glandulosa HHB12029 TaxID=1314781 RepID=A0A165NYC6_EXIGL|nr:hypothetical protein EXIGLDRAFT_718508 [Exidia glandulosa HHB12029]